MSHAPNLKSSGAKSQIPTEVPDIFCDSICLNSRSLSLGDILTVTSRRFVLWVIISDFSFAGSALCSPFFEGRIH